MSWHMNPAVDLALQDVAYLVNATLMTFCLKVIVCAYEEHLKCIGYLDFGRQLSSNIQCPQISLTSNYRIRFKRYKALRRAF
jgi:hypothetical protein